MSSSSRHPSASEPQPRRGAQLRYVLSLLLILVLGGVALRSLRADLAYTPLDIEVGFWGREN